MQFQTSSRIKIRARTGLAEVSYLWAGNKNASGSFYFPILNLFEYFACKIHHEDIKKFLFYLKKVTIDICISKSYSDWPVASHFWFLGKEINYPVIIY